MQKNYYKLQNKLLFLYKKLYTKIKASCCKDIFSRLQSVCLFIGYPRSGHSLVGSLLDAHPNMLIANELDALSYIENGLSREQIFYLLLQNSKKYASKGRIQSNYNYNVQGQWQGKFTKLQVIGDKKGGMTTERISRDFSLIDKISNTFGLPVIYIHVIRNPFDNITTMALRTNSTLEKEIDHYFYLCETNKRIKNYLGNLVFDMTHENLILKKEESLYILNNYIGICPYTEYIKACSSIIADYPSKTRQKIKWTLPLIKKVDSEIKKYNFLKHYTFDT